MKLIKIIQKNIKLLLRSRISSLVIILAPLLIILLVGMSFSNDTKFYLNIGVYSSEYTKLTESFIDKLNQESYAIQRYDDMDICIDDIKYGEVHTCIIFPPDLKIENQKTNEIIFHVDKSKVNLVYLIINSLAESISSRSSELSYDLTMNIVDVLFNTKDKINSADQNLNSSLAQNNYLYDSTSYSEEKLSPLDLTVPEKANSSVMRDPLDIVLKTFNDTKQEALYTARKGLELMEDIEDWTDLNMSRPDIAIYKERFERVNRTVRSDYDSVGDEMRELTDSIKDIDENLDELSNKLAVSKMAQRDVLPKLKDIKERSSTIKAKLQESRTILRKAVDDINSIKVTAPKNIVSPITTNIQPVNKEKTTLNYMFPSLIVLLIMFVGLILPSILIIIEKNSRSFFRVFTTPTKDYYFIISDYLTALIFMTIQILVIFLISEYYFKINLSSSIFQLLLLLFLVSTVFIFSGMLIGYLFDSEEIATLASLSLGSLFLFTSGIIFPIESMPQYVIDKVRFNPFVLSSEMLKKILIFEVPLSSIEFSLKVMILYSFVLLIIIFLIQRLSKIKILTQISTKRQIKKEILQEYFSEIKTLNQFITKINKMPEDRFQEAHKDTAVYQWILKVGRKKKLAKKIKDLKTKPEIISILKKETRKNEK
ncbi:hypothetical protein GF327_09650 [Candidatus Woesearchaeota archaeon]|nr:hypothetical protein [Candidatus Woesearchaeota archaeon]